VSKTFFTSGKDKTGSLPFLDAYVESFPDTEGEEFEILEVKETRSRAGYLLYTNTFMTLLWKSDEMADNIITFLESQLDTNPGKLLGLKIDSDEVCGCTFYTDDSVPRLWVRKKKTGRLFHIVQGTVSTTKGIRKKL
jgi:hypothetical protein